jgi:hypothetical protein
LTLPTGLNGNTAVGINADAGDLADYLHFSGDGSQTVIEISSSKNGPVDQVITLANIDLTTGFGSDTDIIKDLLARGKLLADVPPA